MFLAGYAKDLELSFVLHSSELYWFLCRALMRWIARARLQYHTLDKVWASDRVDVLASLKLSVGVCARTLNLDVSRWRPSNG